MFRTLAIAWMLIATPLVQAQALMHCQLTDAATTPVGDCCCDPDEMPLVDGDRAGSCCTIELRPAGDTPDALIGVTASPDDEQANPATGPPPAPVRPNNERAPSAWAVAWRALPPPAGEVLWLETRRLRL